MYLGRDGLCHDVEDAIDCQGGRRLYYTAYGDPICDCPRGQFPFPGPQDNCVAIFTRGPCREGQVVTFNSYGVLICSRAVGQSLISRRQDVGTGDQLQILSTNDVLNPLGFSIPCQTASSIDYDVFKLKMKCLETNLLEKREKLEENYVQLHPAYAEEEQRPKEDVNRSDDLLNPCRPGKRNGNNFKCTNSFM